MSLFDYRAYQEIKAENRPFYALIMAAMESADSFNQVKLKGAWPEVWAEIDARYNRPGGLLPGEIAPEALRIDAPPADPREAE